MQLHSSLYILLAVLIHSGCASASTLSQPSLNSNRSALSNLDLTTPTQALQPNLDAVRGSQRALSPAPASSPPAPSSSNVLSNTNLVSRVQLPGQQSATPPSPIALATLPKGTLSSNSAIAIPNPITSPCGPGGCHPLISPLSSAPGVDQNTPGQTSNQSGTNASSPQPSAGDNNAAPGGNNSSGDPKGSTGGNPFTCTIAKNCPEFISPLTTTPGVDTQGQDGSGANGMGNGSGQGSQQGGTGLAAPKGGTPAASPQPAVNSTPAPPSPQPTVNSAPAPPSEAAPSPPQSAVVPPNSTPESPQQGSAPLTDQSTDGSTPPQTSETTPTPDTSAAPPTGWVPGVDFNGMSGEAPTNALQPVEAPSPLSTAPGVPQVVSQPQPLNPLAFQGLPPPQNTNNDDVLATTPGIPQFAPLPNGTGSDRSVQVPNQSSPATPSAPPVTPSAPPATPSAPPVTLQPQNPSIALGTDQFTIPSNTPTPAPKIDSPLSGTPDSVPNAPNGSSTPPTSSGTNPNFAINRPVRDAPVIAAPGLNPSGGPNTPPKANKGASDSHDAPSTGDTSLPSSQPRSLPNSEFTLVPGVAAGGNSPIVPSEGMQSDNTKLGLPAQNSQAIMGVGEFGPRRTSSLPSGGNNGAAGTSDKPPTATNAGLGPFEIEDMPARPIPPQARFSQRQSESAVSGTGAHAEAHAKAHGGSSSADSQSLEAEIGRWEEWLEWNN